MGANAQTSVPTFTAGEILTAANMNISARTGIPVFATTVRKRLPKVSLHILRTATRHSITTAQRGNL